MTDPTPDIDWYPPQLRDHERLATKGSLWDNDWDAGAHISALPPDPHERNAALRALNQISGMVYACRVSGGLIKIGYSEHMAARRAHLKGELLAFTFGTYDDEQAIHAALVDHLATGREWYYPTPGVLAVVNDMRQRLGLEPVAA